MSAPQDKKGVHLGGSNEFTVACSANTDNHKLTKKRKKKGKKSLYEQYLADSGSDCSYGGSDIEPENVFSCEEFVVGMDINTLIQQTVQNVIQSVCLEQDDGMASFGDHELTCFAAAVKHNSSILSLQIRYLDVSDISLIPLCCALREHPRLRALDLSGTRGGEATSKALSELVCTNPNIIFVRLDDIIVSPKDAVIIHEATLYNAMVCSDPTTNPFHLGLLRKISAIEEEEQKYQEQLQPKAWLFGTATPQEEELQPKRKAKKVTIISTGASKIGAEVCAQYIQGRCAYGSRCKYFHPERTSALKNAVATSQYFKQEDPFYSDTRSGITSVSSATSRHRLQSRLRPSHITFNAGLAAESDEHEANDEEDIVEETGLHERSSVLSLWILSATVMTCCITLATLW